MAEITMKGRHVLLTGVDPHTTAHVMAMVREGASVTLATPTDADWPTSLKDLRDRGLITHDPHAEVDLSIHDMVLGAAPHPPSTAPSPAPATSPAAHSTQAGPGAAAAQVAAHRSGAAAPADQSAAVGSVTLVGGGPGDPGLITVAGLAALKQADVVVTDRLAPLECLEHVPEHAEIIDVAKIPRGEQTSQQQINEVLIAHASAGKHVVRFKGGDSFVFGRGGEEAVALAEVGITVDVIPGVTSSIAAPALAGIPVTHRGLSQGFTVVSGHVPPGDPRSTLDWGALAHTGTTLVVLMGVQSLPLICASLLDHGMDPATPAAMVADAGLTSQRAVRATVAELPAAVREAGLGAPAVTVIGPVAGDELPGTPEQE